MIASFILGFFTTGMVFVISVIIVVGVKTTYLTILKFFSKYIKKQPPPPVENEKPPVKTKRQRKTTHTIEIDPDLADRIYFKKSS